VTWLRSECQVSISSRRLPCSIIQASVVPSVHYVEGRYSAKSGNREDDIHLPKNTIGYRRSDWDDNESGA
jgi:hypothetical protein